jgi:hypothetical protein
VTRTWLDLQKELISYAAPRQEADRSRPDRVGPAPRQAHQPADGRRNRSSSRRRSSRPARSSWPGTRHSTRSWCGASKFPGNDPANATDLIADAPPIYVQEKIDPRVLIENLRRTERRSEDEPEFTLFDSFDGLEELDLIEFYKHEANWSNRMILGDSLQVMGSLAEREDLRGKVQMVYLDPPYGIKFGSNWQASSPQARRQGRQGRGRRARGRADQGVPRHVGVGDPLLPVLPARPAHRRPRPPHGDRLLLRPDRRRERPPRPVPHGRGLRPRELRQPDRYEND